MDAAPKERSSQARHIFGVNPRLASYEPVVSLMCQKPALSSSLNIELTLDGDALLGKPCGCPERSRMGGRNFWPLLYLIVCWSYRRLLILH